MRIFFLLMIFVIILVSCGESSISPKPSIEAPTGLTAVLMSSSEVQLNWTDNSDTETGFIIERKMVGGNYETIALVVENVIGYLDSQLDTNTEYYYRIAAILEDDYSDWSYSNIVQTPIDILAPSNLAVDYLSSTEVDLSWVDNTDTETGFLIQRRTGNGDYEDLVLLVENVIQYADLDIASITVYSYRVSAQFDGGQTDWSNEMEVITPPMLDELEFGMDETLDVMTWNVEHFPKNGLVTIGYMVEIIQQLDVDIIALQEIESNSYFENLLEYLEGWDGYKANSASYDIDVAYLYKLSVIDVENIFEIYESDWQAFPRNPLVMEFSFNNVPLVVINNHLKAGGGMEDEYRRQLASIRLEEYIEDNLDNDNVIVVGDWNDQIEEPEEDNVFWNLIEQPERYLFTDMEIAQGSHNNWSYPGWPSHLDHIMITNELFDEFEASLSDIQTLKIDNFLDSGWSEYDNNISDHRPVAMRLVIGDQ